MDCSLAGQRSIFASSVPAATTPGRSPMRALPGRAIWTCRSQMCLTLVFRNPTMRSSKSRPPRSAVRTCICTKCSGLTSPPATCSATRLWAWCRKSARRSPAWRPGTGWSSRLTFRAGTAGCAAAPCTPSARPPRCERRVRAPPLFGCTSLYGSVPGGQAEFLRVPQAQFGSIKIPADGPDEQYLILVRRAADGIPGRGLRRHTLGRDGGPARPGLHRAVRDPAGQALRHKQGHRR